MSTASFEQRLSLREREKVKTRRTIQEHALRLFAEQGYDATTMLSGSWPAALPRIC